MPTRISGEEVPRLTGFIRRFGKVSFRSTGATDVNAFARQFGGGGHAKAAGALVAGGLGEVRDRIVESARQLLRAPA